MYLQPLCMKQTDKNLLTLLQKSRRPEDSTTPSMGALGTHAPYWPNSKSLSLSVSRLPPSCKISLSSYHPDLMPGCQLLSTGREQLRAETATQAVSG